MSNETDKVILHGVLSEITESIDDAEWAFFEYANDIADQIYEMMEVQGVTKAELARKLVSSKPFVTKILRGDANLTFKTFTKIAAVLNCRINTKIVLENQSVHWFGIVKTRTAQKFVNPLGENFSEVSSESRYAETSFAA